jgi:hypothetical protein
MFRRMWSHPTQAARVFIACATPDYMPEEGLSVFGLLWKYIALAVLTLILAWLVFRATSGKKS